MGYEIRMGIPEMEKLWNELRQKHKEGTASKVEEQLYKKWGNALKKIAENSLYPSLKSHEIDTLSRRYGSLIWKIRKVVPCECFGYMDQNNNRLQLLV